MFIFGSGPVKGFAVTLGIGIITTLFTAYFFARHLSSFYVMRNKNKEIKYDLIIDSSSIKTITTKNKKGDPELFHIKIVINVDIIENNKLKNQTILEEGFEYKNKSNKFQLNKYEKTIQKNLTNKLSKDLIDYLYYIK